MLHKIEKFDPGVSIMFMAHKVFNLERCIALFKSVWLSLPDNDQCVMADHIRNHIHHKLTCEIGEIRRPTTDAYGLYNNHEMVVWFSDECWSNMSADVASAMIAHELAHLYQYATNTPAQISFISAPTKKNKAIMERDADIIARDRWRYDQDLVSSFKVDQFVSSVR